MTGPLLTDGDEEGHWHRPFVIGPHRHRPEESEHTHDEDGYAELVVPDSERDS